MKRFLILGTLFCAAFTLGKAQITVQAEDGGFNGGVSTSYSGYTGTGFVDVENAVGSFIQFEVSVNANVNCTATFRYAHGKSDDRSAKILVNGTQATASLAFPATGGFSSWKTVTQAISLVPGTNVIRMEALFVGGLANIDKLDLDVPAANVQYKFTLNVVGKGKVTQNPAGNYFNGGTVITLNASAVTGANFDGWSGAVTGTEASKTITISANTVVTATFTTYQHSNVFCAPTGNDQTGVGTIDEPYFSLEKAVNAAIPGDTIYMRGGTYEYTKTQMIGRKGTATDSFYVYAYQNEKPIISNKTWTAPSDRAFARTIFHNGDYFHYRGLEICYSPDNGIKVEGSHNVFELCIFHHNGDSGIQIGLAKEAVNDGTRVCYNSVINCDSYLNADPATIYENADGFACKLYPGPGNYFYGCRAWHNADDGWDFYMTVYPIVVENCWAFHNGDHTLWGFTDADMKAGLFLGDGNGFKLGGDGEAAKSVIRRSIAFECYFGAMCGFLDNNNGDWLTVLNCVAWECGKNFKFNGNGGNLPHVVKNCAAWAPKSGASFNIDFVSSVIQGGNSWTPDGKVSTASPDDFISTSKEDFWAPRQTNGELPIGFGRLKSTSDLIDKGVDVGLTFRGSAPDIGAYEYEPSVGVEQVRQMVNNLFTCIPSVITSTTRLEILAQDAGKLQIKVASINGDVIYQSDVIETPGGYREEIIDLSAVKSGIYVVTCNLNGKNYTSKVVKK